MAVAQAWSGRSLVGLQSCSMKFPSGPSAHPTATLFRYSCVSTLAPSPGGAKVRGVTLIDVGYGVRPGVARVGTKLLRQDAAEDVAAPATGGAFAPAGAGGVGYAVLPGGSRWVGSCWWRRTATTLLTGVRMDVRDQTTGLKPEDVSILYFEPRDLDVKIHSIRLDEIRQCAGRSAGSYRRFFTDEISR